MASYIRLASYICLASYHCLALYICMASYIRLASHIFLASYICLKIHFSLFRDKFTCHYFCINALVVVDNLLLVLFQLCTVVVLQPAGSGAPGCDSRVCWLVVMTTRCRRPPATGTITRQGHKDPLKDRIV